MCETRRGYVMLLQGGDPEISGALKDGALEGRARRLNERERATVASEIDRQETARHAAARGVKIAIGRNLGPDDYAIMRAAAEQDYRIRAPGPLLRAALGLYGLAIYMGLRFMDWEEKRWREG